MARFPEEVTTSVALNAIALLHRLLRPRHTASSPSVCTYSEIQARTWRSTEYSSHSFKCHTLFTARHRYMALWSMNTETRISGLGLGFAVQCSLSSHCIFHVHQETTRTSRATEFPCLALIKYYLLFHEAFRGRTGTRATSLVFSFTSSPQCASPLRLQRKYIHTRIHVML